MDKCEIGCDDMSLSKLIVENSLSCDSEFVAEILCKLRVNSLYWKTAHAYTLIITYLEYTTYYYKLT